MLIPNTDFDDTVTKINAFINTKREESIMTAKLIKLVDS